MQNLLKPNLLKLKLPLFPIEIWVIKPPACESIINKHGVFQDEEVRRIATSGAGATVISESKQRVFVFFHDDKPAFSTIAHEATHAIVKALRLVGTDLAVESEELYCYAIGWLTGKICKFFEG